MKVKIAVKDLSERLSQLGAVVDNKATIPSYSMVKLEVVGEKATVTGTGPQGTFRAAIKAEASEDGAMLLPTKRLQEILPYLPEDSATFTTHESKIKVTSGRYKADLLTLPVENFQAAIDVPENHTAILGLPGLKALVEKVLFAVPPNDGKYVVSVALLDSDGKEIRMVATDGFRLVIAAQPGDAGVFQLQLPKSALDLLSDLNGDTVKVSESDSSFVFQTDLESLFVTKTSGAFPPYQKVLPTSHKTEFAIAAGPFTRAILRTAALADEETQAVAFSLAANGEALVLKSASHASGFASDEVDVKSTGAAASFALNTKMLLPFLEKAGGDLTVRIKEADTVVDFHAGPSYRFVIMPVVVPEATK